MDADRFEALLRTCSATPSRRGALRLLGGSVVGLLGWTSGQQTAAHNARRACAEIKNQKKQERCIKRAHKHNARHAGAPVPSIPPAATCTDEVKNGGETDVDCGGTCPRCANNRACTSQDDCASAHCVSGVCQACRLFEGDCGIDSAGACECRTHNIATQPHVCTSQSPAPTFDDCDKCPDDTFCVRTGLGDYTCFKPCGAV